MNHTTGPPRSPNNELVRQLFMTYQSALRAYLYKRVRRRADAEELAQEVYLRLLRVPDVTAILNPEAYLYAIAKNLVKEYALQQSRGGTSVPPDDPGVQERLSEFPSFPDEMDREQRIERLREDIAATIGKVPGNRGAQVLARPELRGDRGAARYLAAHGEETPEPRAGALPTPDASSEVSGAASGTGLVSRISGHRPGDAELGPAARMTS